MYNINKLQGYTVQHREYSQYFRLLSIKTLNHYVVYLKLLYCESTILQLKKKTVKKNSYLIADPLFFPSTCDHEAQSK